MLPVTDKAPSHRERRENAAHALGYADWIDLIDKTRDRTLIKVAELTGIALSVIHYWRNKTRESSQLELERIAQSREQVARTRELAQTAKTQAEIGEAMGLTDHQQVSQLIKAMPDGQHIRDQIKRNNKRWREQSSREKYGTLRRAIYTPDPEEVAEFKRLCVEARPFRAQTPMGSPMWEARDARDAIVIKWHENLVSQKDVARFGDVSTPTVAQWHAVLIKAGRLQPRDQRLRRKESNMTVNYHLDKIEKYQEVCWIGEGENRRMHPITEALIWLGNGGGYSGITEANAGEIFRRVSILAELWGPPAMHGDDTPWFITQEDVRKHIGMSMNWTAKTKTKFNADVKYEREKQARTK